MIYISLGSNVGHRLANLQKAVILLKQRCLKNVQCSVVLETQCLLLENSPLEWDKPFLNMIVSGTTDISPEHLLPQLKQIEYELGRPAHYEKWSPRIIDLDILLWDNYYVDTSSLKIPHPDLKNRPFLTHLLALMDANTPFATIASEPCFLRSFSLFPRLVGVVNITPDSFSDGGHYHQADKAIEQAIKLTHDGASIIEIGAQSTRPSAILQTPEEEYAKLKPVLDGLMPWMNTKAITVSVDTFQPSVIHKIVDNYPIAWINNVTGNIDEVTLKRIAESQCSYCIMHSLGIPPSQDNVLSDEQSPMEAIIIWAKRKIDYLMTLGFNQESLILDPGVGFGKTVLQNMRILHNLDALKTLGFPVLIGHSRKSYINAFSIEEAKNRDIETLAISALLEDKADFLRVHNVKDHQRFFVANHAIKNLQST